MDEITPATLGPKCAVAYGLGRSYDDSCLNDGGVLMDMRQLVMRVIREIPENVGKKLKF